MLSGCMHITDFNWVLQALMEYIVSSALFGLLLKIFVGGAVSGVGATQPAVLPQSMGTCQAAASARHEKRPISAWAVMPQTKLVAQRRRGRAPHHDAACEAKLLQHHNAYSARPSAHARCIIPLSRGVPSHQQGALHRLCSSWRQSWPGRLRSLGWHGRSFCSEEWLD